jgi:hypothetical protein
MSTLTLTIVSFTYDGIVLAISAWWLFYTTRTYYDRCCSIFALPLFVLLVLAISSSRKDISQRKISAPVASNLLTLILIILLAAFRTYWDLDFIVYGNEYSSVLTAVDVNSQDYSNGKGIAVQLPQQYQHLSRFGEIYLTVDNDTNDVLIVFPTTPDDLDGLLTAYIYSVDPEPLTLPQKCLSGRPVNPYQRNWYYCVVALNQIYGKQSR